MDTEKLSDIKKELSAKPPAELQEICIRLARYKKDNKELIAYLLYNAHDPQAYAEQVKIMLSVSFEGINRHPYYSAKTLRKVLKQISRYAGYTALPAVEVDLLLWFCEKYIRHTDAKTNYKPLQNLLVRQLLKLDKLMARLHEDLRFDYRPAFDNLQRQAAETFAWYHPAGLM